MFGLKKIIKILSVIILTGFLTFSFNTKGQGPVGSHTVVQKGDLDLIKASHLLGATKQVKIFLKDGKRYILSNGLPSHMVGEFPNSGNPNGIKPQSYTYSTPEKPMLSGKITRLDMSQNFGVGVNGVPFDPVADEWYKGKKNSKWRYEALSGAIKLGVDENHAHVQPNGAYHYHGIPKGLLSNLRHSPNKHSPVVGWAADGFPVFALYGREGDKKHGKLKELKSSYQLKKGSRPGGDEPSGVYDGTFIEDYEFLPETGDLDECNGKLVKTREFPDGTYAYFLTNNYPVIPRCLKGTPDPSFNKNMEHGARSANDRVAEGADKRKGERGRKRLGPPKEARDACMDKKMGSRCSFKIPNGMLSGVCFFPPAKKELVCRPSHNN